MKRGGWLVLVASQKKREMKEKFNNIAKLLEGSVSFDCLMLGDVLLYNALTYEPSPCKVLKIEQDTIAAHDSVNGCTYTLHQGDVKKIPLDGSFFENNGFNINANDKFYTSYRRDGQWTYYQIVYDKMRRYYSFSHVGSCMPLRSVDELQRLLKMCGLIGLESSLKFDVLCCCQQ